MRRMVLRDLGVKCLLDFFVNCSLCVGEGGDYKRRF